MPECGRDTLRAYLVWSQVMKDLYARAWSEELGNPRFLQDLMRWNRDDDMRAINHVPEPRRERSVAMMGYWLAALYVVVEGWQALRLSDAAVDALLGSPHIAILRRLRNGFFHCQSSLLCENAVGCTKWRYSTAILARNRGSWGKC